MSVISRGRKNGFRREGGKLRSVPDSLTTRQALHADAPPTPVVDQPFQRLAEGVEEHLIDPFDQLAVAAQLHRVEIEATLAAR